MKYKILTAICFISLIMKSSVFAVDLNQTIIKLDLSQDLITFLKFTIWCAGIFLVLIAGIGVAFFGFDVRKARTSIDEMTKEIKELISNSKQEHAKLESTQKELSQLKSRFEKTVADAERKIEELGAQIEEYAIDDSKKAKLIGEAEVQVKDERSPDDLIREIIKNSSFKWTTIGQIRKKTGLSSEKILERARSMKDIEISTGRKSKDHIFRIIENS